MWRFRDVVRLGVLCAACGVARPARAAEAPASVSDAGSTASPTEGAPSPAAPATVRRGAGTVELRLQTASNVSGADGIAFTTEPGFAYDFKTHDYLVNLIGGAAFFLSS